MSTATQQETIEQKIARLEQENAALKAKKSGGKLSIKLSAKGGVSVYGLGRFPVTLYGSQWEKLLASAPQIADFLIEHDSELSVKE